MKFQKADAGDLELILALQHLTYQSEARLLNNFDIPPLMQTLDEVKKEFKTGVFLKVTDDDNVIVGSVRGHADNGTLYIGKLIVHPDMQGKGLGTRLLKEMEEYCPHKRYELFTSSKSTRNIRLYKRAGYRVFTEKKMSDDLKFIYMEKEIEELSPEKQ